MSNPAELPHFTARPWHYATATMPGRHAAAGARLHAWRQWGRGRPPVRDKAEFLAAELPAGVENPARLAAMRPVDRPAPSAPVGSDSCGTTVTARHRTAAAIANLHAPFLAARLELGAVRARKLADLGIGHTYETLTSAAQLAATLGRRIYDEARAERGETGPAWPTGHQLAAELAPRLVTLPKKSRAELAPGVALLELLPPDARPTPGRLRKLAKRAVVLSRRDRIRNPPERWHRRRVKSVSKDRLSVIRNCGTKWARIHCGCSAHLRPIACDQREMCDHCGERWRKRLLGRLLRATRGLERAIVKAPRGLSWGRYGRWAMLSLSVSSVIYDEDGNPVRYRSIAEQHKAVITDGWANWRSWLQKKTGRSWPYAWVPEVTDGDKGGRHPHWHCIIMLPMIPFDEMAEEWVRATDGAAGVQGFDITTPTKAKLRAKGHDQQQKRETPLASARAASQYICKYATKGIDCAPETAAEFWEAMFGKRRVSTSQGFWELEAPLTCPDCGCGFVFDGVAPDCGHGPTPRNPQGP